jgi:hypothetical protein
MVPVPAVTRCSAASPSRPIRSWTWPGRRPSGLATATSAPSTSCSGCSPRATAGPPSSFGRLGWSWRRSGAAAQRRELLGIDLDTVRHQTEQRFGVQAVGEATWRVTRRRWWWGPRVVWTPLCGPPLVAKRALQLASQQAHALGHGEVRPEHLLLGVLEDARQPTDKPKSSRRHRQVIAHLGLPDGYHGAAGPLLAGLEVDLGRLREVVAAELRGVRR